MRALQGLGIANEQRAGPVRKKEALVRIEARGIGTLDAGEPLPAAFRQGEESPVSRVDVEPQSFPRGEVREPRKVVDGSRVRRAAVTDEKERRPSGRPVFRDSLREGVQADAEQIVGRNLP